jgi:hypothetical protein
VDSARYDMVDQCVAGGQPKFDLLTTHARLQYRVRRDDGLSRLIYLSYYPNQSIIGH